MPLYFPSSEAVPSSSPPTPTSLGSFNSDDDSDESPTSDEPGFHPNAAAPFTTPRASPCPNAAAPSTTPRASPCTDNRHQLGCGHTLRTRDPRCSTACRRPRWGPKRPIPHACAGCSDLSMERWLLTKLREANVFARGLQELRIDHWQLVPGATTAKLEEHEDALELLMEGIRLTVGPELWEWYSRNGLEALEARVQRARVIKERGQSEARARHRRDTALMAQARQEAESQAAQLQREREREVEAETQAELARARAQQPDGLAREPSARRSSAPATQSGTIPATIPTETAVELYEQNLQRLVQHFPQLSIPPRTTPHPGQIAWAAQAGGPAAVAEHMRLTWSEHARRHGMLIRIDALCDGDFRILQSLPLDCLAQVDRILQVAPVRATITTEDAVRIFEENLARLRQELPEIYIAPRRELDPAQIAWEAEPADLVNELLLTHRESAAHADLICTLCDWNIWLLDSLPLAYLRQLEETLERFQRW